MVTSSGCPLIVPLLGEDHDLDRNDKSSAFEYRMRAIAAPRRGLNPVRFRAFFAPDGGAKYSRILAVVRGEL